MDKVSEISERIVCGGNKNNLSSLNQRSAKNLGEKEAVVCWKLVR
jgi:hypothetical protein